ncbi:MAG: metal ABC transporter substrate-binding protein [Bacteriovoracaceae bacterium]|jgi:zinc/manganese transport system substrate-binding protein|nr:metal ABC transporter substrate-binding protein [Bacteriovoracaceae bacterium]
MFIKIVLLLLISVNVFSKNIVSTLPELNWVVEKLTEQRSISLLSGTEDPHFVDASPSFIFKVAKADLVIMNGLDLEIGWFPKVVQMSGNKKVQPQSRGFCDASKKVKKVGLLKDYNRSMGDIHPGGNPHYTLSLLRMAEVVDGVLECLVGIGYERVKLENNAKKIKMSLLSLFNDFKDKFKDKVFYVYHREFQYLAQDFKLNLKESLEEVPGVLPSASFLSKIAQKVKQDRPLLVLAGNTSPIKILKKFKEISGVNYIKLDLHPKRDEDYLAFMKKLLRKIK